MRPAVGSWKAAIRLMMVDFPEPEGPTSAVTVPGSEVKLTSRSTVLPASYSKVTFSKAT